MTDSSSNEVADAPDDSDGSSATTDWSGYSDVLDNKEFNVGDRVNALAPKANTVRIAVGYFYLGGFDLVKENVNNAEQIELIIGTHTSDRTIEELQRGFSDSLDEYNKDDAEPGIRRLYELIQLGKVDVRVYNDTRFHPKLYLFKNPPDAVDLGRAIIGSSNMSASGLRGNVELNVEKKDNATIRYLENWFGELWEEASEFNTDLMVEEIEASQFGDVVGGGDKTPPEVEGPPVADVDTISPYEATKRFIVEQFRYEVYDGTFLQDIQGEYEEQLTAFQDDAFRAARRPLDNYNGVILADSVGLGKSYIGAPLVKEYTTSLDEVLVIAPNRLKSMWMDDLLDEDDGEFSTHADKTFLSFAGLSRLSEQEIQRLQNVDLVLIDEAHNLRNTGTQRYAKLQSIGRRGKKFIMLTATPIQNSVRDVENVVKVFADDDDFDIELHGRTPSDVFREYDKLSSQDDLSAHEQSQLDQLEQDIESILREVVISRDRRYILDEYEDITIGGEPIKIPDRVPRIVTPDDPRLDDLYAEIIETILGPEDADTGGLNIPYVSADRYDADGDEKEELIVEYQNASVLMLINLLKRLESSFAAFEDSIDRLIQRERVTRQIARGELRDSKTREQAVKQIRATFTDDFAKDIDFDDVTEAIGRVSDEKRQKIIDDIDQDLVALKELRDKAQSVLQTDSDSGLRDTKVTRLQSILDRELESEKVLVFSQYVPTVYHIFEQLTGEDPATTQIAAVDGRGGDRTVAYVHGGGHFDESLVDRFAPRARDVDVTPDEEIDILITTDVLGVGQNLQDSRVLVNYDLHWNPMKMEQRIGRIDRITTRHDELLIYNFVPTGNLKEQLGLMDRIQKKIRDIARTFGHAAPILDTAEEQVHKTMMTYERLDEDGANFGDDRLEGIGSKYDDLRSTARAFCEEHGIDIEELEETLEAVEGREEPQYFVLPDQTHTGFVTLVALAYDSGREEWQTTIFDEDNLQRDEVAGQMIFANFPRRTTDEIEIFNIIASADPTRYSIPEDVFDVVSSFTRDISSPSTWQNDILQRDAGESRTITRVKRLCQSVLDAEMDLGVEDEAEEIIEMISGREMSDWAEQQIETVHRRRRRYGRVGTIERLYHKLTAEIELVEPEQITDVDVALTGKMAPTITQEEETGNSDE